MTTVVKRENCIKCLIHSCIRLCQTRKLVEKIYNLVFKFKFSIVSSEKTYQLIITSLVFKNIALEGSQRLIDDQYRLLIKPKSR